MKTIAYPPAGGQKSKTLLSAGHNACAGCGQLIAARTVAEALGPDTIIANATGCLEVTTTPYPLSAWGMPWIHSLFENAAAIASGVRAALNSKSPRLKKEGGRGRSIKVVAQGGDGATFDIGFGLISGMWERGENILYICYDNEAYANTGIQASSATPWGANTTTTPAGSAKGLDGMGSHLRKKNMLDIALAHGLKYVASASVGWPEDITRKVKKAVATPGPSYLQILVPCVPGWKIEPSQTLHVSRLAAWTGLYPVLEYENGQLTNKIQTKKPLTKAEEYLKIQGRFKHLFKDKQGREQIKVIQQIANNNIAKYNL